MNLQMRNGIIQAGIVAAIVALIVSIAKFILRHPLVVKMLLLSLFLTIITFAINKFVILVSPYIVSNPITQMASAFGVMQGIAIYISIILSGFGVKQVLAFFRTTG